jgi:hypothetical protein
VLGRGMGQGGRRKWGVSHTTGGALALALVCSSACAPSADTVDTAAGRDSIKTRAVAALSDTDCDSALSILEPLVLSEYSDNEARELYASAYACDAGMSSLVGTTILIGANSGTLTTALWQTLTQIYYDTDTEELARRYTSGFSAQDYFMAVISNGVTVAVENQFDIDEWNPASLQMSDRKENSRLAQLFLSMQTLGQIQAVKADPDPDTFERRRRLGATSSTGLGWDDPANIDETACGWAGAAVTMVEGIDEVSGLVPDSVAPTLAFIADTYGDLLDDACNASCQGLDATLSVGVDFSGNGCAFSDGDCRGPDAQHPCLMALRNRTFCSTADADSTLDDKVRCAAAGIARFVNRAPLGGWAGTP